MLKERERDRVEGGRPCAEVDENRERQRHEKTGFRRKSVQSQPQKERGRVKEISHSIVDRYYLLSSGPHQAIIHARLRTDGYRVRVADEIYYCLICCVGKRRREAKLLVDPLDEKLICQHHLGC